MGIKTKADPVAQASANLIQQDFTAYSAQSEMAGRYYGNTNSGWQTLCSCDNGLF